MNSRIKRVAVAVAEAATVLAGAAVWAQVKRPYRNGSVWGIAFIKVKPGLGQPYVGSGPEGDA